MLFDPETARLVKRIVWGTLGGLIALTIWATWAITRILSAC